MSSNSASNAIDRAPGGRKLIAVVYADMVGYSRLIGLDDIGTLERLRALRSSLIDPTIAEYGGRIVNTGGDSLLIVFDSIDGAVRCAVRVQQQVPVHDGDQPSDRTIRFRVGINIGDAIADGTDVHGDVVNVAARLQAECPPGGVCITRAVRDHVHDRLDLAFEDLGSLNLKNIARPVDAFVLRLDSAVAAGATDPAPNLPLLSVSKAPRLSIVVLPFRNLGGDPNEDYLADAIGDDLTTDLSHLPGALVIARESALTYKGKAVDVRQTGQELGVRYIVEGSVRRLGAMLRVNVQLVSTESGAHLWADRFDQPISDLAGGQNAIVRRIALALGIEVVHAESARSKRDRPTNPDAFDLILRARSLQNQPTSIERILAYRELFEQALCLDPSSVSAMTGLVQALFQHWTDLGYWPDADTQQRAFKLQAAAQSIAPAAEEVLAGQVRLLESAGRYVEMMAVAERLIDTYPSSVFGYLYLARGKIFTGSAQEAIPLLKKTIQLNPRDAYLWDRYWRMGFALLLIGRYAESIVWHRRALAVYPDAPRHLHADRYRMIAAANALGGQIDEARRAMSESNRLWPFATIRRAISHNPASKAYEAQIRRYQDGLRLAGLRDHADEDADFDVIPTPTLVANPVGLTPTTAPGATTIRTLQVATPLTDEKPTIIDTVDYSRERSVPGAVGLGGAGMGWSFADNAQHRLGRKMQELTRGDLCKPIVAVGWNSERFGGYNLALRLVALGYTQVYWYRGGFEAWQVNGLPETDLVLQDW